MRWGWGHRQVREEQRGLDLFDIYHRALPRIQNGETIGAWLMGSNIVRKECSSRRNMV